MRRIGGACLIAVIVGAPILAGGAGTQDNAPSPPCSGLNLIRVREAGKAEVRFTSPRAKKDAKTPASTSLKLEIPAALTNVRTITLSDAAGAALYTIKADPKAPSIAAATITFNAAPPTTTSPAPGADSRIQPGAKPSLEPDANGSAKTSAVPYAGAAEGHLSAQIDNPRVASLISPSPAPSGEPNGSTVFIVQGNEAGTARLVISDGPERCVVGVAVIPAASRFALSSGLGVSNIPIRTYSSTFVTPPPTPTPAPSTTPNLAFLPNTLYVNPKENSGGQTFVPILANYRVTDFPYPFNLFLSAGISASGDQSKQLYGLSYGNKEFLLTLGTHTQTVEVLTPGLRVGPNLLAPSVPQPATTFLRRASGPFMSLTFELCSITGLIPGTTGCKSPSAGGSGGGTATASMPSPSPSPGSK
ncbi:MAG: hypothetical protein NVS4B3_27480 [Gemmatimonadaceae bacterium]